MSTCGNRAKAHTDFHRLQEKPRDRSYEKPQAPSILAWDLVEKIGDLCGFIASYVHLYAFIHGCFCNLRKPLARSCIHIFLAAGRADLRRDIPNHNGRLTSGKSDRCDSWFSLSILADDTLHERFLLAPALSLYNFFFTLS